MWFYGTPRTVIIFYLTLIQLLTLGFNIIFIMEVFSSYWFIIIASVTIIVSYLFSLLSKKTGIPSVLLLIALGIGFKIIMQSLGKEMPDMFPILKILGLVGLVMIVLEASLDLKISAKKTRLIVRSLIIASTLLVLTTAAISFIIYTFFPSKYLSAIMHALPLSIMSSAIIIPSVEGLKKDKKEFMIYESTFSDILGIMFFYFIKESLHQEGIGEIALSVSTTVIITIIISFILSYGLIILFQNIKSEVKLFMFIAILTLLFSLGKTLHLSALLIILVFGSILTNRNIFFRWKLKKFLKEEAVAEIFHDFKLITLESSFVMRTFFFIVFGMIISLQSLVNLKVIFISVIIIGIIYAIRYGVLIIFYKKDIFPQLFLAPRGLITILLFFEIGDDFLIPTFNNGIFFFIIIISSIIMAIALSVFKKKENTLAISDKEESPGNHEVVSLK